MALGTPAICMTPDNLVTTTTKAYVLTTTAGNAVFVCAACEHTTANPPQMTIADTAGWTWTLVRDETYATGANPRLRSQVWQATSDGTSNTVTVNGTGTLTIGWEAFQISGTGVAVKASNNWFAIEPNGDPSGSFPNALGTGAAALVYVHTAQNNALTNTGTGLTALGAQQPIASNGARHGLWYDLTTPSQGPHGFTSTNLYTTAVGFELYEVVSGGGGGMKVWSGSAWAVKPLKVWTGSAWVAKPVKFWNGSAWEVA